MHTTNRDFRSSLISVRKTTSSPLHAIWRDFRKRNGAGKVSERSLQARNFGLISNLFSLCTPHDILWVSETVLAPRSSPSLPQFIMSPIFLFIPIFYETISSQRIISFHTVMIGFVYGKRRIGRVCHIMEKSPAFSFLPQNILHTHVLIKPLLARVNVRVGFFSFLNPPPHFIIRSMAAPSFPKCIH